ncbi:MAG: prolipoprotein diacylglyceryl transferase [Oscillospiraceae bacterium]|nr:prolipoprotein diacylglyceryl transferase [Oscillospiraceae bacterium]
MKEHGYRDVHPTFLYEMLVLIGIFIFLTIKKDNRKFRGEFTYIYLMIYGLRQSNNRGIKSG